MSLKERYQELDQSVRMQVAGAVIAALVLALLYSALNDRINKLSQKRAAREKAVTEMLVLSSQYQNANNDSQRLNNRLAAVNPDDSLVKLVEETGIKGKNRQIKPTKGEERQGSLEDAAEVTIESLSANEVVNLLHKLEKGDKPVVIKKANLKARYDDPAKIDITLTMALLKPLSAEKK
jgi:general secretion pathway protein M